METFITDKFTDQDGRMFIKMPDYFSRIKFKYEPFIKSNNCFAQRFFPKNNVTKNYLIKAIRVYNELMEYDVEEIDEIKCDSLFYPIIMFHQEDEVIK